jgi:hypothetical protein
MIDLSESIPSFLNYVNPLGQTLFTPSDAEVVQRLTDAFWTMRLFGADWLANWTCSDGIITPQTSPPNSGYVTGYIPVGWYTDTANATDVSQAIVQGICLFAALQAVNAQLLNLKTSLSVKAGPVSFESAQSTTVLTVVQKSLTAQVDIVMTRLTDLGFTDVGVFDAVMENTRAIENDMTWFVRGSYAGGGMSW